MSPIRAFCASILFFSTFTCTFGQSTTADTLFWKEMSQTIAPFAYHVAVVYEDNIYVAGGLNHGTFAMYSPSSGTWHRLQPLPMQIAFPAGTAAYQSLYIMGGIDTSGNYLSQVFRYDFTTSCWSRCADMPVRLSRHTAECVDGQIYVIGGLTGTNDTEYSNNGRLFLYDPVADRWLERSPMPLARHGHASTVSQGKIIVAGGYGPRLLRRVDVYDPSANTWTRLPDMLTSKGFFGLISTDQSLIAFCGRIPVGCCPVEKYDFNSRTWSVTGKLPEPLNRFGTAVVADTVYLIGGEETPHGMRICPLRQLAP